MKDTIFLFFILPAGGKRWWLARTSFCLKINSATNCSRAFSCHHTPNWDHKMKERTRKFRTSQPLLIDTNSRFGKQWDPFVQLFHFYTSILETFWRWKLSWWLRVSFRMNQYNILHAMSTTDSFIHSSLILVDCSPSRQTFCWFHYIYWPLDIHPDCASFAMQPQFCANYGEWITY